MLKPAARLSPPALSAPDLLSWAISGSLLPVPFYEKVAIHLVDIIFSKILTFLYIHHSTMRVLWAAMSALWSGCSKFGHDANLVLLYTSPFG